MTEYMALACDHSEEDVTRVALARKTAGQRREDLLQLQKKAGREGWLEEARMLRAETSDLMRLHRACDLWIKWVLGLPGWTPAAQWPAELARECRQVDGLLMYPELLEVFLSSRRPGDGWVELRGRLAA